MLAGARLLHDYRGSGAQAALAEHLRQLLRRAAWRARDHLSGQLPRVPGGAACHLLVWRGTVPVNYKLHKASQTALATVARVVCVVGRAARDAAFAAGADPAVLQVLAAPGWSHGGRRAPLARWRSAAPRIRPRCSTPRAPPRPKGVMQTQRQPAGHDHAYFTDVDDVHPMTLRSMPRPCRMAPACITTPTCYWARHAVNRAVWTRPSWRSWSPTWAGLSLFAAPTMGAPAGR